MHLCLTVECITSSLQFLQHCLSAFLSISFNPIRSHTPPCANPHLILVRQLKVPVIQGTMQGREQGCT